MLAKFHAAFNQQPKQEWKGLPYSGMLSEEMRFAEMSGESCSEIAFEERVWLTRREPMALAVQGLGVGVGAR